MGSRCRLLAQATGVEDKYRLIGILPDSSKKVFGTSEKPLTEKVTYQGVAVGECAAGSVVAKFKCDMLLEIVVIQHVSAFVVPFDGKHDFGLAVIVIVSGVDQRHVLA